MPPRSAPICVFEINGIVVCVCIFLVLLLSYEFLLLMNDELLDE